MANKNQLDKDLEFEQNVISFCRMFCMFHYMVNKKYKIYISDVSSFYKTYTDTVKSLFVVQDQKNMLGKKFANEVLAHFDCSKGTKEMRLNLQTLKEIKQPETNDKFISIRKNIIENLYEGMFNNKNVLNELVDILADGKLDEYEKQFETEDSKLIQ